MISKKFKVRVKYYNKHNHVYVVQYSHHWLVPKYKTLMLWNTKHGYIPFGTTATHAEETAETLKSIEDVKRWDKAQEDRKKQTVPYSVKQIL